MQILHHQQYGSSRSQDLQQMHEDLKQAMLLPLRRHLQRGI